MTTSGYQQPVRAPDRRWVSRAVVLLLVMPVFRPAVVAADADADFAKARQFWSFQPIKNPAPPPVKNPAWAQTPLDRFILAKLETHGLRPSPPATKAELIRRVSFDVTGLPPSPDGVRAFVEDRASDAYERLVDRLLASPHFGERWAQHWLDTVRFAETEGFEYDRHLPEAWRFRDYVIESFNRDKPFDRFLTEQLAGDEMTPPNPEHQTAAIFHRLGPVRRNAGNPDIALSRNEVLTERTDVIGAAFLGLTVGCARCHDHKLDPIPQRDYYRLQAYLAATQEQDINLGTAAQKQEWETKTKSLNDELRRLRKAVESAAGEVRIKLMAQIEAVEAQLPPPPPTIPAVRNDPVQRTAIHVLKRGEWERKGEPVGPRALSVLVSEGLAELSADAPRPRTELARWLADPSHPLTARVIANRLWQHHFGVGLVKTPNDFGSYGDRPSHPELLDWLASELVNPRQMGKELKGSRVEGLESSKAKETSAPPSTLQPFNSLTHPHPWSLKHLHRLILLSSAYQQSSHTPATTEAARLDPDNRWLWRFHRRRLSAEEIRDSMLAVSGQLSPRVGGPSVMVPVDVEMISLLYKPAQWAVTKDATEHHRRSIYLLTKRNLRLPFMEAFDQPAQLASCGRRESSTHAPQALELLNGRLANELAAAFAARLARESGGEPTRMVERASQLALGRAPTPQEHALGGEFLKEQPLREFALALFNLNAFLYVE